MACCATWEAAVKEGHVFQDRDSGAWCVAIYGPAWVIRFCPWCTTKVGMDKAATQDVEAALEAIQEATGTLALQAALPVGDTGQIMDFASRSLATALATLRAEIARLQDNLRDALERYEAWRNTANLIVLEVEEAEARAAVARADGLRFAIEKIDGRADNYSFTALRDLLEHEAKGEKGGAR